VLIHGPDNTPYEDGIFLFDIMLPSNYPDAPPMVHYVSFCSNRLNPNLYECGKVCVSLLGTWSGKGTEVWTAESSLLQLLVSIQGKHTVFFFVPVFDNIISDLILRLTLN